MPQPAAALRGAERHAAGPLPAGDDDFPPGLETGQEIGIFRLIPGFSVPKPAKSIT